MPHGKLSVVVEGAIDIKDPGIRGKGGSYCTLTCGSQVLRSRTVEGGGRRPLFSSLFEFEIDRTTNELKVCIYNERGSSREGEMVGYCTLIFKQVFYYGHTLPLTSYPLQLPSGNSGGQINMSLKFKMRPSPKALNIAVPLECGSSPTGATTHKLVAEQSLPLDWGYDGHEEGHNNRQPQPESRQLENPTQNRSNHRNLPGSASGVYKESARTFLRYGNSSSSQTTKQTHPNASTGRPRIEYDQQLLVGKPQKQDGLRPQLVQVQVQLRPGVVVKVTGEATNGFAQSVGSGIAEALGDELVNGFLSGAGPARLEGQPLNPKSRTT